MKKKKSDAVKRSEKSGKTFLRLQHPVRPIGAPRWEGEFTEEEVEEEGEGYEEAQHCSDTSQ